MPSYNFQLATVRSGEPSIVGVTSRMRRTKRRSWVSFGLAEEGIEQGDLVAAHFAARFGIGQRHRPDHAKPFEQRRHFDGVRHRVALGVERELEVVGLGLADERETLNVARELFELRRAAEVVVEGRR